MTYTSFLPGLSFVWQKLPHKIVYSIIRVVMCCATAWVPLISGAMVNLVTQPGFSIGMLCFYVGIGLAVEIVGYGVGTWVGYFWSKNVLLATMDIKKTLWRKVQKLSAQRWDSMASGMWMSRIGRDAGVVLDIVKSLLDFTIGTVIAFVFASVVILLKVPILWLVLVGFAVLQVLTYLWWRKDFRHMARRSRELDYTSGQINYDLIEMTALFKCFGVSHLFYPLYDGILGRITRRSLAEERLGIRYNTMMQVQTWTMRIFVVGFCLWLYTQGRITLGDIIVYNMYMGQLIGIASSVTGILPSIEQGRESATALTELLEWCENDARSESVPYTGSSIKAEHLTFAYQNSERQIIQDFSVTITPKSYVCFIGRNGSGKSTLIKLLMGVYSPTLGRLTTPKSFAFVPQHNAIYNDTFLENVRLRDKTITVEAVEQIVRMCGLGDFLNTHPLQSKLRPNTLSGGELQMLGIARAMVRQPEVLLLDELTNNLDIVAQEKIHRVLESIRNTCTIISVTHNLHSTKTADRVFLFQASRIIELMGTPTEREEIALRILRSKEVE